MPAKQRFPWVGVSAVVAVVIIASIMCLQLPESENQKGVRQSLPPLGLTQLDRSSSEGLLAEQLAAYDPAPLFIPSPMNSNEPPLLGDARVSVSSPFGALRPELTKTGAMRFPAPVPIPGNTLEGLRLTERAEAPLALGRGDAVFKVLGERVGRVEVVDAASGSVVAVIDLPPSSAALPEGDWQPLELMGAVTRSGLAGELVVTTSSGSGEIDEYFRSHLTGNVRIGERLSKGFYAFRVGP